MATSAAVPRVSAGPRRFPNLPVIQHPMSRLNDRQDLAILGSASGLRHGVGNMSLQVPPSGTNGLSPKSANRASAPERILQWPPEYVQGPHKSRVRQESASAAPHTTEEVTEKIKEKLNTGFYGLRHMFKANDPTGKGVVSREALLRILYSLVGYLTQEQFNKFLKGKNLEGRESISFDSFVACFKDNETVQKEWVSPLQKLEMEKMRHNPEANLKRTDTIVTNPFLSAPYSDTLFKDKIRNIEDAKQVFPAACFQANGRIVPPQLREAHAQLGIFMKDGDFMSLWQRYDKEGLGAIRTSLFLKRAGIETRPKTFTHRSKTTVDLKVRPKSEVIVTSEKQGKEIKHEEMTHTARNEEKDRTGAITEGGEHAEKTKPAEADGGKEAAEVKVGVARKKKVQPKLENIIDCLHYRFEESYNAMATAFDLFDYLSDGYISRVDFRRVLQEFGLNVSVTDLDNFLARNGVRTIRGQVNYKEFLNKFQSKSENSVTNKLVTSPQFQDKFPSWPLPQHTLTSEELDIRLVDLLHGDFLKLIGYFRSCDKYGLGVITPHEFRSGIEKRLGYPMSDKQWEQLKSDVGQDSDGLIPYNRFLQMFDVSPGSWNRKQEGGLDVSQVIPSTMVHSSAVDRLREKAKTFMHPQAEMEDLQPQDNVRTIADVMKILEELFRNRFHTFDKHFQDMDRRKTGRMSKWQFGALLRLSGVSLTNSELDRVWARLNVSSDGMYSYKSLIMAFAQNRLGQEVRREQNSGDTKELIEAAKRVQRERREKTMSSLQQNTTTTTMVTTNTGEQATTKTTNIVSVEENTTKTTKVDAIETEKLPQTALSNKSQRIRSLLNKIKPKMLGNWEGLKTVFKFIDKNGSSTISISDMKEVLNTMKFPLSEEEKRELCQRFDLQRNGRFHYLEFMKCYSQSPPTVTKSQVYSKHTHKLERKLMAEHKNLRRAFRRLDVQRRGFLGITDFRRALTGCNIHVSNEDFYHILSEFDQDMRGRVAYSDFLSTFVDTF
ncbi:EF-hand calcium-binding domain-containing protein 6-like isoform X9 [Ostrea edulis]|uniref:EF-hand calcium-binding domain-containing protein 6-like isoform X9 n=1 Tax=Ostrea edulis TaxID=37623 RepID=UPI0024AF45BA|nr:EF-hand calcium-binding domain-containing protein 6-like isoform X9 [Ostrea edulis]